VLSITLATFAVAYLLRPLGGFVFGHIGDRFGRRRTMLLSVALMTVTMLGAALLPTHAQVGALAGWMLFLLRCVMGFSVGGEYIAVVAYLLEGAPRNRRGLITSLASASSEIGGLLAVGVSLLTVNSMSSASLDSWGWRIPFLVGAVLAGSVGIARTTMEESPDFERQQASGTAPANPLLYALINHGAAILRTFAISALGSITYYVGITYIPTFLTSAGRLDESDSLRLSAARGGRRHPRHALCGSLVRPDRPEARPDRSQPTERDPADHALSYDSQSDDELRQMVRGHIIDDHRRQQLV
jgi:MHS family proline/betaine transporter-like MFS transporter